MWELDHKESWTSKNWCFWVVVLKTLESPLDCKEIQPVISKENQSSTFIRSIDAEAPILWPADSKSWLIRKDPDAGKDWRQEETGRTEDEMVGWHHRLNEHEFEQAPGNGEGQGSLACCSPWGCKESDTTERLNNNTYVWVCVCFIYIILTHVYTYSTHSEQDTEASWPNILTECLVPGVITDPLLWRLVSCSPKRLPSQLPFLHILVSLPWLCPPVALTAISKCDVIT